MNLDAYITLLQSADATINRANAARLAEAVNDLARYATSIAHRRTGYMADSIVRYGPFSVGAGVLEAKAESAAPYADLEVARGGDHDWATRTLVDRAARILQLELEIEGAVVRALTGAQ